MEKPIISLKNVKYAAFLSEETSAFTATVFVDGVRFGTAENSGKGGATIVRADKGGYAAEKELNERIKATYPKGKFPEEYGGGEYERNLENVIDDALGDYLALKDYQKKIKNQIVYVKEGKAYAMPKKFKPTLEMIDRFLKAPAALGALVLNTMQDQDQAFDLYKAAIN